MTLRPDAAPTIIFVGEPTWSVEGLDQLYCHVVSYEGGRKYIVDVSCLPIPQKYLLIIGDSDGNPVSEHLDKPVEKTEETT